MSLQKYNALLKTVELGSISLAAEQMGYSQPAVSKMISDLESDWGVTLLHRSRAGLEPSSVCLRLLPILQAIQSDTDDLTFTIEELHGIRTGLIRVGLFTSVADMLMPIFLNSFQKMYPKIEFDLINMESYAEIEKSIYNGKIDCGFVSLPTSYDLQTHFLMRDELVAVLPKDHKLANADVFPVAELEGVPFIKLREKVDLEISRFLNGIPFKPNLQYQVSSDHTILAMVENGIGISINHSLISNNSRYNVVCKRFDVEQHRDIAIATSKKRRISSTTKLFVDHVKSCITELPHNNQLESV